MAPFCPLRPLALIGRSDFALSAIFHGAILLLGAVALRGAPDIPIPPLEVLLQAGREAARERVPADTPAPLATKRPVVPPAREAPVPPTDPPTPDPNVSMTPPSRVLIAIHDPPALAVSSEHAPAENPADPAQLEGGETPPNMAEEAATEGGPAGGAVATLVDRTPIVYPRRAKEAGVQGSVTLVIQIDPTGKVTDIAVQTKSGSRWLDAAAVRGVRSWSFQPALVAGVPVESWTQVTVEFVLAD